jgi:MFS family permease
VLLGRLFDTIGRRRMIAATYGISGLLLAATGYLFAIGVLDAATQTLAWAAIFFFASAAASAAYLTASEVFPMEMRAIAIAIFYALGTGSRWTIFGGYAFAAALMLFAAAMAARYGVDAEGKALEDIAAPLSVLEAG